MKIKMHLRTKLIILVLAASVLLFGSYTIYVGISINKMSRDQAELFADNIAEKYSKEVESKLNFEMGYSKAMANFLNDYNKFDDSLRVVLHDHFLMSGAKANRQWTSLWSSVEYRFIDSTYTKPYGRKSRLTTFEDGKCVLSFFDKDMDGEKIGSTYDKLKSNPKGAITDPYPDEILGVLLSSTSFPFFIDNEFAGIAGIDLSLEGLQESIQSIELFDGAKIMIASNNGTVIAHSDRNNVGKSISSVMPDLEREHNISNKISSGISFSFTHEDDDIEHYTSFSSFSLRESDETWTVATTIPLSVILENANKEIAKSFYIALACLALLIIVLSLFARSITRPLSATTRVFENLSKGDIDSLHKLNVKSGDELEEMSVSVNNLIDGLQKTENFAKEIETGNLDAQYDLLGDKDRLGNALLEMRNSLRKAADAEKKRKEEEDKRTWATQGIAKFAELLRKDYDKLEEMAYNIISNLVKYVDANQGGMFLLNDNDNGDHYLELMAAYAYNRRKFLEKRIDIGEGLVGRAYQEGKIIYMTDIPDDYIQITSGLGQDTPRSLAIVPMIINDQILGIIEIASFSKFEKYQLDFIEKIGESIAASISSLKVNIQTSQLLEQTKQQAEEMQAQEEEMRQNMEELQATQEESSRREEEIRIAYEELENANNEIKDSMIAFNSSIGVVEYDTFGSIYNVNEFAVEMFGVKSADELHGMEYNTLPHSEDFDITDFGKIWKAVSKDKNFSQKAYYKSGKDVLTVKEVFVPFKDSAGDLEKITCIITVLNDVL
jgi:methyl-accepting chemotaxis protein